MSGALSQASAKPKPMGFLWEDGTRRLASVVHHQPLLLVACAASSGVLLQSQLQLPVLIWVGLFAGVVAAVGRLPCRFRWLAVLALVVPLAALRQASREAHYHAATLLSVASHTDQPVVLEGTIDRPTVLRRHPQAESRMRRGESPYQSQLEVSVERLRVGQRFEPFGGRVWVSCDGRVEQRLPGDRVRLYGALRGFEAPTNPGERDLRPIYRRRGLHARLSVASPDQIVLVEQRFHPWRLVASIARWSRNTLLRQLDDAAGPLAVALVVGQRDFVDRETRDRLLVTGTAHLLSVSGLHLAIVVALANWLAVVLRLPMKTRLLVVLGVCLFYAAVTGARPPVMRATVLVAAVTMAISFRRPSQPLNSLGGAAIALLTFNPDLLFSVGTQLSFLAVTTLLVCNRGQSLETAAAQQDAFAKQRLEAVWESSLAWPLRWGLVGLRLVGQMAWFSGCVTTVSMPLVWMSFHVISPVSVIANVLVGPILFVALGAGLLTVLASLLADPLAQPPAFVCDQTLGWIHAIIDHSAAIPGGHVWLPAPPAWWVILFYVGLALSLCWSPGRRVLWLRIGLVTLWTAVAWWMATQAPPLPAGTVEATFVDVGHGTSVVLRSDKNRVWLYDCGRLGNDSGSSRDIEDVLWSLGATRLEGVFLSHADADHYNAMPGILRRFDVVCVMTPPGMMANSEGLLATTRQSIAEAGVPLLETSLGDRHPLGDGFADVLHPPADRVPGSDNANSLVLRIDRGSRNLLLPGDLEAPGTHILIEQPRPPVGGVLMAPHHGSLSKDSETVLQWARPRETIVSGGPRARRVAVTEMLSMTGSTVYVTARQGAIRVRLSGEGDLEIRSWCESPW